MTARRSATTIRLTDAEHRSLSKVATARGSTRAALIRDGIGVVLNAPVTAYTSTKDGAQRVVFKVPDIPDSATEAEKERLSVLIQSALLSCCPDCDAIARLEPPSVQGPVMASVQPVKKTKVISSVSLPREAQGKPGQARPQRPMVEVSIVIAHSPICASRTGSTYRHPSIIDPDEGASP